MTRVDLRTSEWHDLITPVLPHASTDKDDPLLQVVRLEIEAREIIAVATDRTTLAAERLVAETSGEVEPAILHLHRVLGRGVTSRWIDQHGGNLLESFVADKLNDDPEDCAKYAQVDVDDLSAADVVVSFTSADGGGKGGRHVEFGLALGLGKRLVIVGPRENVFHTLPHVEHYPNWSRLVMAWSGEGGRR